MAENNKKRKARDGILGLVGFAINTVVLGLAALLLIPALVVAAGSAGWAHIAVGQALGGFTGIVVGFGWGIIGPSYVANAEPHQRARHYLDSLVVRLALLVATTPFLFAATFLLLGSNFPIALLSGVVIAAGGVGPGWYFIGRGSPFRWLFLDTTFRAGSTAVAALIALNGAAPYVALCVQLVGVAAGTIVSSLWISRRDNNRADWHFSPRSLRKTLASQTPAVAASLISGAYSALPIVLVSVLFPSVVPAFAILDKIQKQFGTALSPVVQVFQGHIARGNALEFRKRARHALVVALVSGVLFLLAFAIGGHLLVTFLGAGSIYVPATAITLSGGLIALSLLEQSLNKAVLGSLRDAKSILRSSAFGSSIGIVLLIALGYFFGVNGTVGGLAIGLAATVTYSYFAYRRAIQHLELGKARSS